MPPLSPSPTAVDHAVSFARHFARLVWLIRHEAARSVDEQKAQLRALTMLARDAGVTLLVRDGRLVAEGTPIPDVLAGVTDVTAQMIAHDVRKIVVDARASPADILGLARALAAPAEAEDFSATFAALGARTVRVRVGDAPMLGDAEGAAPGPDTPPPAVPSDATPESRLTAAIDAAMLASMEAALPAPPPAAADPTPAAAPVSPGVWAELDGATTAVEVSRAVERLSHTVEAAVREGRFAEALDLYAGLVAREAAEGDAERRRPYLMAYRRLALPRVLELMALAMVRDPSRFDAGVSVLQRAGADGADAVLAEVARARTLADRQALVAALRAMPEQARTALTARLADVRSHIARLAADLLGELALPDADRALAEGLRHPDERVRRGVAVALVRFDTPFVIDALGRGLTDPSPSVRLQAVNGLASRRNPRAATALLQAIDGETDIEVQLAMIAALGRLATPDAVIKLSQAAAPDGRIFRRKNLAHRVAAAQALAAAGTPGAMSALQALLGDKEKEVRDAVFRAMLPAARRTEPARA